MIKFIQTMGGIVGLILTTTNAISPDSLTDRQFILGVVMLWGYIYSLKD